MSGVLPTLWKWHESEPHGPLLAPPTHTHAQVIDVIIACMGVKYPRTFSFMPSLVMKPGRVWKQSLAAAGGWTSSGNQWQLEGVGQKTLLLPYWCEWSKTAFVLHCCTHVHTYTHTEHKNLNLVYVWRTALTALKKKKITINVSISH